MCPAAFVADVTESLPDITVTLTPETGWPCWLVTVTETLRGLFPVCLKPVKVTM